MIIVRLIGGLGNQMFQYAFARRLAADNNAPVKLDLSNYATDPLRSYQLHHFNINERFAGQYEIDAVLKKPSYTQNKLLKPLFQWVDRKLNPHYWTVVTERGLHFNEDVVHLRGNIYLQCGYWHSERYFEPISEIIRKEFALRDRLHQDTMQFIPTITSTDSISLHIRRGDYATDPKTNRFHGMLGLDYYAQGLNRITRGLSHPHIFVFSDDPDWVQKNVRLDYPTTYVKHKDSTLAHEEMYLMSLCKHNIIANSSFSWWGAWLNLNEGKRIIAPKRWFLDENVNTSDHVPVKWDRI